MLQVEYLRPELIRKYQKQVDFIDAPSRYTIVEATTKAGKTTGCIVWLFEQAVSPYGSFYVDKTGVLKAATGEKELESKAGFNYWWVAPVYSQAKIAFRRMKRYIRPKEFYKANESELSITLKNGAIIWFKSAEKPDNLYGDDVYAVVFDEMTRAREEAWYAIRSTLTFTKGPCKMIGNVKGTNNWAYKLAREAETGTKANWSYFKLTAADAVEAGVLPQEEIDDAEATLPKGIFLELYYAIPFVNSANKFVYAFNKNKCVKKCKVNYDYPIYLSFDFNRNPISCNVIQYYNDTVKIPYVIKLENSNIYRLCEFIKNKFVVADKPEPYFIVNGDASGAQKLAIAQDDLTYFRIIKKELGLSTAQMQQLASNPRIEQNQVLVNAVLEHVKHEIDPDNSQALIFDLEFAEMLPDGKLKKADRDDPKQQLDALDGYRYWCNRNMRQFIKGYRE